jgi:thiol:disulfide interchange protein DsbA
MNRTRRLLATLIVSLSALPVAALAQPRAGDDYVVLQVPQQVEDPGRIEVIEFFWYGCIHCYNLEPLLENWVKKLPADVTFKRVPAVLSQSWARDAAIFYALEALGALDRLHRPLFDAIHRDKLRTDQAASLNAWLAKNGVDPRKFEEALRSFGVQSKARRAAQLTIAYRVDGTPAMGVQGRYVIGGSSRMLETTDHLIGVARRAAPAKK